jgi:hypothetical protein
MLLRYLPYQDYGSALEEKDNALNKELEASQGGGSKPRYPIHYKSNFSHDRHTPYLPGFRPDMSLTQRMRGGIRRISHTLLVPRLGTKNIPLPSDYDVSYRPFEEHTGGKPIRTLRDVERVYYVTGQELYGRTEMRSVWKGNDLKPRIYYSRGASMHRASCFIQQIFNAFVDSLDCTHRHDRHNTSTLHPGSDERLTIYDYSSFTSLLSELPKFTEVLAEEFMETFVTVLDPHNGPILVSLGEMLHEYNETCNRSPTFDASEIMHVEEMVLTHNTGMLGIPGNISSSTLLHGIHLSVLVHASRKCKVVGDDAIYHDDCLRDSMVREAIQDLGKVALEKMESWDNSTADEEDVDSRFDYKKRPINRIENTVFTGFLLDFPPLTLANIVNPMHRSFHETDDTVERKAAMRVCKFMDDVAHFPSEISDIGKHVIFVSQRALYRMRRWSPIGGRTRIFTNYPPICDTGLRYSDWVAHFADDLSFMLPVVYVGVKEKPDSYRTGQVFYQKSSALLSYLAAISCLEDITEYELVSCRDLVDRHGVVSPRLRSIHIRKYAFLEDPPYWFEEYFQSLLVEDA